MKISRFTHWLLFILLLLSLSISLSSCLYITQRLSLHERHARQRVSSMFTALKNGDYETALKYCDPTGKWNIDRLKRFLQHGGIPQVDDFEIVKVEIDTFKNMPPWMRVYVKVNNQWPPIAFHVEYDEIILYAGHNSYLEE